MQEEEKNIFSRDLLEIMWNMPHVFCSPKHCTSELLKHCWFLGN